MKLHSTNLRGDIYCAITLWDDAKGVTQSLLWVKSPEVCANFFESCP